MTTPPLDPGGALLLLLALFFQSLLVGVTGAATLHDAMPAAPCVSYGCTELRAVAPRGIRGASPAGPRGDSLVPRRGGDGGGPAVGAAAPADGRRLEGDCLAAQCYCPRYAACFHLTSQECKIPEICGPTQPLVPTARPTFAKIETEHPVLLRMKGLPSEFRIIAEVRAVIMRYVKELLEVILVRGLDEGDDPPLRLLQLSYAGRIPERPHDIAMRARVSASQDVSSYALSFLLDTLQGAQQDIVRYLRRLDSGDRKVPEAFKNVLVDTSTYAVEDVSLEETATPTPRRVRLPSRRPTPPPTVEWDSRTTYAPTADAGVAPLVVDESVTATHEILLELLNVEEVYGNVYSIPSSVRQAVCQFVKDLLNKQLGGSRRYLQEGRLEVMRVLGAGWLPRDPHVMPLLVTTRGPRGLSDQASPLIRRAILDKSNDLIWFLRQLDGPKQDGGDPLRNVRIQVGESDTDSVLKATVSPSASPVVRPVEVTTEVAISWWIWLVAAVAMVLVVICFITHGDNKKETRRVNETTINETRARWNTPHQSRQALQSARGKTNQTFRQSERRVQSVSNQSIASAIPKGRRRREHAKSSAADTASPGVALTPRRKLGREYMPTKTQPDPTMFSTKEAAQDATAARNAKRQTLMKQARQESHRACVITNGGLPDLALFVPRKAARDPTMISPDEAGQAVVARREKRKASTKQTRQEYKCMLAITNGVDKNTKKHIEPEETLTKHSTNDGIGDGQRKLDPEESRSTHTTWHATSSLPPLPGRMKKHLTASDSLTKSVVWRAGRDPDGEMFSVSDTSSHGKESSQSVLTIEPDAKTRKEKQMHEGRPSHQSKGIGKHSQRRSTTTDMIHYSMGWVSGRAEEIDYLLANYWSDCGSESNEALIAIESEEERRKAKRKRKKEKKERRHVNEEISFLGHSEVSGETQEEDTGTLDNSVPHHKVRRTLSWAPIPMARAA